MKNHCKIEGSWGENIKIKLSNSSELGHVIRFVSCRDNSSHEWVMEVISCPLCGCAESEVAYRWASPYDACSMTFEITRCTSCGFIFTNPRFSKASLQYYYSAVNPYASNDYHCTNDYNPRFVDFLNDLKRNGVTCGRLLEIGCDKGQFLSAARQFGFEVEGIEPSASADIARKRGLLVHGQPFEEIDLPDNAFECVVMLDVLEHMSNPIQCLQKVSRLLKPGGSLLIKVPNVRHEHGFYPFLRGKSALRFGAHEHLSHFSMESLTRAVEMSGVEVFAWLGFVPIIGPRYFRAVIKIMGRVCEAVVRKIWRNWPDYHVSLVCLGRKTFG